MMATQMTNKYNVREVTLIFCNQYHMKNQSCSDTIDETIKEHLTPYFLLGTVRIRF